MKNILNHNILSPEEFDQSGDVFTTDQMKELLPIFSEIKLADIIVMDRYIGLYPELAVEAMKELSNRRINGNNFKYEEYIETTLKELPDLNFTLPEISSILDSLKVFK